MQEGRLNDMQEKDERIRELERELSTSKNKLQSAENAEVLVGQMLEAGALVQQDDGSYSLENN